MKLYHGIPSVCSIKARIGLAETGQSYESIALNLQAGEQHAPQYLKLNPNGVVPTLVDGDLVVTESSLILEYLDREYNQSRLMPKGRAAEAAARLWLLRCIAIHAAINTLTFSTAMRATILSAKTPDEINQMLAKMPDPVARMKRKDLLDNGLSSGFLQQAFLDLRRAFADMDMALSKSDWISGPEFGIVDVALIAYIDRLQRLGFEGLFAASSSRISDWLARMQARDSYQVEVAGKIPVQQAAKMRADGANFAIAIEQAFAAL